MILQQHGPDAPQQEQTTRIISQSLEILHRCFYHALMVSEETMTRLVFSKVLNALHEGHAQ
jgi:hypothetical protein